MPETFLSHVCCSDEDIDASEVEHALRGMHNHKSLGPSWVSVDLIRQLDPSFYRVLAVLFNRVRHEGTPSVWNSLRLLSLHKKGSLHDPDNYRGLSIMAALPKLYACILMHRVQAVAEE